MNDRAECLWVVVPAKAPHSAKSRLAPVLSEEARAVLARLLLARLLTTLSSLAEVAGTVVVSGDPGLRAIARLFGSHTLPDPLPLPPRADAALNGALEAGRSYALELGASALLVLPTDLPWLTRAALETLLTASHPPGPRVVLARDSGGSGTNALFLRPATAIPFHFGSGSGPAHRALALHAGLPLTELHEPAFAHDLDLPEDWAQLVA